MKRILDKLRLPILYGLIYSILAGGLLFFSGPLCLAQGDANVAEVTIGDTVVARIYSDGKTDPAERADQVNQQIAKAMEAGLGAKDVRVEKENGLFVIYWGQYKIVTVDAFQAKANKTEIAQLASGWAFNMKRAVGEGLLRVYPRAFVLPVGSEKSINIKSLLSGNTAIEFDGSYVNVTLSEDEQSATIRALNVGTTKLVVKRGNARAGVTITVKDWAAKFPDTMEVEVTGSPALRDTLYAAALDGVLNNIIMQPGATLEWNGNIVIPEALEAGQNTIAQVPVVVRAKGYFTVDKRVLLNIKNTALPFGDCSVLMVSNRPESIDEDGVMFQDFVASGKSDRLLFSHKNNSPKTRNLWVILENTGKTPAKVLYTAAYAGPDRAEIMVGHRAAMRFFELYAKKSAYVLAIPPFSQRKAIEVSMSPQEVVSGIMHIQSLAGSELKVTVKNSDKNYLETGELVSLKKPFNPFKIHPHGTFEFPDQSCDAEYRVGQKEETKLVIGKWPWLIDQVTGEPNTGNYGAVYKFKLALSNPTAVKQRIGFFFVPLGYLAIGSFVIDGTLIESPLVRNPGESLFATMDLGAGEKRNSLLQTIPEAGSYYPVSINIRYLGESDRLGK